MKLQKQEEETLDRLSNLYLYKYCENKDEECVIINKDELLPLLKLKYFVDNHWVQPRILTCPKCGMYYLEGHICEVCEAREERKKWLRDHGIDSDEGVDDLD